MIYTGTNFDKFEVLCIADVYRQLECYRIDQDFLTVTRTMLLIDRYITLCTGSILLSVSPKPSTKRLCNQMVFHLKYRILFLRLKFMELNIFRRKIIKFEKAIFIQVLEIFEPCSGGGTYVILRLVVLSFEIFVARKKSLYSEEAVGRCRTS